MTTVRRILGSGSFYTVATIAPIITLLGVTPIVTTILGAHQYGQVAVAISVYQVGSVLLGFGLPTMVTRDALLTAAGFRGAVAHVVTGGFLAVLIGALAIALSPIWGPVIFPGVDVVVIAWSIGAGAGLAIVTLAQGVMRAAERVGTFVAMASLAALLPPIFGVLLTGLVAPRAASYAAGLAGGYLISGFVALILALKHAAPKFNRWDELRALRVGLPTVPHSLAVPALLTVMIAIVIHTGGVSNAGPLQVAVLLGSAVVTVLNAVNNAWAPLVMRASDEDRPKVLSESSLAVSGLSLILLCGFSIGAPILIPLVGGPVVHGTRAITAACLVAAAGVFHMVYLANINLTFISQRTWPLAISTPLSAIVSIVASFLLARVLPASEALLAFAFAWPLFYAIQAVVSYWLARLSPYATADLRSSVPFLITGAIVAVQAIVVMPQPLWSIVFCGLSGLIFLAVIFGTRIRLLGIVSGGKKGM